MKTDRRTVLKAGAAAMLPVINLPAVHTPPDDIITAATRHELWDKCWWRLFQEPELRRVMTQWCQEQQVDLHVPIFGNAIAIEYRGYVRHLSCDACSYTSPKLDEFKGGEVVQNIRGVHPYLCATCPRCKKHGRVIIYDQQHPALPKEHHFLRLKELMLLDNGVLWHLPSQVLRAVRNGNFGAWTSFHPSLLAAAVRWDRLLFSRDFIHQRFFPEDTQGWGRPPLAVLGVRGTLDYLKSQLA